MVYHLTKYELEILCTHLDQKNPAVVVTLGSEVRTLQLEGLINFWVDMVKVGRKAVEAHLALTGSTNSSERDKTPTAQLEETRPEDYVHPSKSRQT